VQTEEGESDDSLINEDRVLFAAPDELRECECEGRGADDAHRCLSLCSVWSILVPESSDHVHEHARALALDCRRVGTLNEREDLL